MREIVKRPYGRARGCRINNDGSMSVTPWTNNLILDEWGAIVSRSLTLGQPQYRISGMYLEFANVSDPVTPVTAPTYDRSDASGYFAALAGSPDLDYLRIPLVSAITDTSDRVRFPKGNVSRFFGMSVGSAGVHGKPFTSGSNSKLYGVSLIAMVDPTDASQDLVLSRLYFASGDQLVKANSQVGCEYELTWE